MSISRVKQYNQELNSFCSDFCYVGFGLNLHTLTRWSHWFLVGSYSNGKRVLSSRSHTQKPLHLCLWLSKGPTVHGPSGGGNCIALPGGDWAWRWEGNPALGPRGLRTDDFTELSLPKVWLLEEGNEAAEQRESSTTLSKQRNYGVTIHTTEEPSLNKRVLYRRIH